MVEKALKIFAKWSTQNNLDAIAAIHIKRKNTKITQLELTHSF